MHGLPLSSHEKDEKNAKKAARNEEGFGVFPCQPPSGRALAPPHIGLKCGALRCLQDAQHSVCAGFPRLSVANPVSPTPAGCLGVPRCGGAALLAAKRLAARPLSGTRRIGDKGVGGEIDE